MQQKERTMKKQYLAPEMEVVYFESEDIMTESNETDIE